MSGYATLTLYDMMFQFCPRCGGKVINVMTEPLNGPAREIVTCPHCALGWPLEQGE